MRKLSFFFMIALMAVCSCSPPGINTEGGQSATREAPTADDTLRYTPDQYWVWVNDVLYDFTQPGTYTWKNSFRDATARMILIGGGGGGGGSGSAHDADEMPPWWDVRGGGGGGGGAGQVIETSQTLVSLTSYTVIVGSGGARGRRGDYGEHGHRGGDGTLSQIGSLIADFGRGGGGGHNSHPEDEDAKGGFGYPSGGNAVVIAEKPGLGGDGGNNGNGHGHAAAVNANGNDGHPAPANSGGGGGGASGAQGIYKGNHGGYGGSGRVTIIVSGYVKAYRIQNRWTGEYLYEKLDPVTGASLGVAAGYVPSTMNTSWWMEEYVAAFNTVRLKNMATAHNMHIEDPALSYVGCGPAPLGWYSAQWFLDDVDGYKRIRNLWKGTAIHVENHTGMSQIGAVPTGYFSSQWNLVPLTVTRLYLTWKNRASGAYLNDPAGNELAQMSQFSGTLPQSAQWFFGETGGFLIPVNRATGDSLHIEIRDGQARVTDVPPNYFSSHWALEESCGYVRFRNRWTGEYLYQYCSDIARYAANPPTLESSQWVPALGEP